MRKIRLLLLVTLAFMVLAGCETTNSIPYKASTLNIITIQQTMQSKGKKVSVGEIALAKGVEEEPVCRMLGPVKVGPGKTPAQYIKEAFQEELFTAGVYEPNASAIINGQIEALSFSSVAPANWTIRLKVWSSSSAGYTVSVNYPFGTSFTAISACKNVADAFGPAVQELLKQVVTNPQFSALAM